MSSRTSSSRPPHGQAGRSSSSYTRGPSHYDDADELDLLGDDSLTRPAASHGNAADDDTATILRDDPLHSPDLSPPLTFKRKHKRPSSGSGFLLGPAARFWSAISGTTGSRSGYRSQETYDHPAQASPDQAPTDPSFRPGFSGLTKDAHSLESWHFEGPVRRVGYEDLTAIDWIFEYTKERQRQRSLRASATSAAADSPILALLGSIRLLLDASQVWIVLVLSGIAVGAVAAAIDVATDWLGDVKYGYCSGVDGGRFYLSKTACCLGYDEGSLCNGWRRWGDAFGVGGGAGKWMVEGVVYLVLAVVFAFTAAVLVKEYAIYAMHSGIPEIKTVLGGFVIRRFLGVWTLITKSLGLVGHCSSLQGTTADSLGARGGIGHVARQRRALGPCCLLLCQFVYQTLSQY